MPNPSELERQDQEAAIEKPDPRNYKCDYRKLSRETADMADRAADEITNLRAVNARLAPQAEAYELIRSIVGLLPQQAQGYEEDLAWRLRERAKKMREELGND